MSLRSDHKALLFLAGIALLGATVRVARAVSVAAPPTGALDHQMQAADSAKRVVAGKRADKSRRQPRSSSGARPAGASPPSAHRDYKGRLDLDVASATEIDSLPGMGPSLAKRIVTDRMANGAFRELTALRRVRGVSPKLLASLDSLVSFSGMSRPPVPEDTAIIVKTTPRKRQGAPATSRRAPPR